MSAVGSYDDTLPTERDVIRVTLGDTNGDDFLLSDALIDAARTMQGSVPAAVAWLARSLIARYATEPTRVTADGVTVDYSERLAVWRGIVAAADAAIEAATDRPAATRTSASVATRALW